ncbi:MAG: hypothetical protein IJQ86_04695 [Spirochaetia bacterium]|nr:hypothetical protein [Spirochaetia bacterium]
MIDNKTFEIIIKLAKKEYNITPNEAQLLIKEIKKVFDDVMNSKYPERDVRRITTKFRDAGRRSAPWKPTSSRVPGRPQDGSDGNRINRWLLPKTHKFYADEQTACLVEIKYYLQALSFNNSPSINREDFNNAFNWLLDKPIKPNNYLDPIQLIPIDMDAVIKDARIIQSGHIFPLDRGGKHHPQNTFLMLARSNQLQGNLSVDELLDLMQEILIKHGKIINQNS